MLLARAKAGDVGAAGDLLWPYRSRVWRGAYGMLRHPQDAEDVVSETFLKAFRSIRRFKAEEPRALEAWLVRIAMNSAKDVIGRSQEWVSMDTLDYLQDHALPVADRTVCSLRLSDLVHDLPPLQRAVVVLVDMLGFKRQEAAEILQVPLGTIDSSLFAARVKLRNGWEDRHV